MDDIAAAAWILPRDVDVGMITEGVLDGLGAPDLRVEILLDAGDALTVQILDGEPSADPDALMYVSDHGVFEVERTERWPGGARPVVLVLAARPTEVGE